MINENEKLKLLVADLPKTRASNREELIKKVSFSFIQLCASRGILSFPRDHLNVVVESLNLSTSQKDRTTTNLITWMLENHLIKEDVVCRAIYTIREVKPQALDYGSYNILMSKNGYKRNCYKWVGSKRVKVGSFKIGQEIPSNLEYDFTELKSSLSSTQQKVLTSCKNSSYRNLCDWSEKKVYTII